MFLSSVLTQLARLRCTNEKLLIMYREVPDCRDKEMAGEIENRIKLRNRINLELEQLAEIYLSKKEKNLYLVFLSALLIISKTEQELMNLMRRPTIYQLRSLEYRNIKAYYKLLFHQPLAPELTNLLLDQKRELEKRDLLTY